MAKPSAGSGKSKKKAAPIDYTLAAEFEANKGKLPWPADGPVVDRFGKHYHPVYKNLQLPPNNGFDLALAKDTKVKAVFDCLYYELNKPQCAKFNPDKIYADMPAPEIENYPAQYDEITMAGLFDFEYKQNLLDQWQY